MQAQTSNSPSMLTNIPLLTLIAANLVPIVGVLYLGWDAFSIVLLYWAENLAIGFYNVLKMAFSRAENPLHQMGKLLSIPFFILHYGGFMAGHGLFVLALFGQGENFLPGGADAWPCFLVFLQLFINVIRQMLTILPPEMLFAIGGLFISHGVSFGYNYVYKGEYLKKDVKTLMGEPYGRVMVMHIAIIAGGFLTMSMGSPVGVLVMLVVLKTVFDVKLHLRQHREKVNYD